MNVPIINGRDLKATQRLIERLELRELNKEKARAEKLRRDREYRAERRKREGVAGQQRQNNYARLSIARKRAALRAKGIDPTAIDCKRRKTRLFVCKLTGIPADCICPQCSQKKEHVGQWCNNAVVDFICRSCNWRMKRG